MKPCPKDSQLVVTGSSWLALSSPPGTPRGRPRRERACSCAWGSLRAKGLRRLPLRCRLQAAVQFTSVTSAVRQAPESRDPMMNEPTR
jgi:hypothetical protein